MKRTLRLAIAGILIGSMLTTVNVWASETNTDSMQESRLVVRKYVERSYNYILVGDIPASKVYSYYDHDYQTTLKGTLTLVNTIDFGSYIKATYAGWCSGSI